MRHYVIKRNFWAQKARSEIAAKATEDVFFTKPSEQLESRDRNEKEKPRKRQNRLMNKKTCLF